MSNLTCPGCGSVYPLTAVQKFDQFKCAVCHATIVVPIAGPAAARAAPPEAPRPSYPQPSFPGQTSRPAAPAHAAEQHSHRPHSTRRASGESAKEGPNWALFGTIAAVAAALTVALVLVYQNGSAPPAAKEPPKPDAPPTVPDKPVAPPKPDPAKDPAAWKALPAAERADLTIKYLTALDRRSASALSAAYSFLKARDELDAVQKVGQMEFERDPQSGWAHDARGDVMILDRIERCLTECTRADETESPGVQRLAKFRKEKQPPTGTWWADAAAVKEVDATLAQIRAEEKELQDPYRWAVAHWKIYQRRIEVMKDHPAITDVVGPYLLFVQVKAPLGTPIESVGDVEKTRAQRVLDHEKELFGAFYDGFQDTFGAAFGLTKYDRSNVDLQTILKANVFADESTWENYHQKLGFLPWAKTVRAYYSAEEPRFLASYDPGNPGLAADFDTAHCAMATVQLFHFYTWDVSRKADGRELSWSECSTRPLWLRKGLADFFASHVRDGGRFKWMQPSDRSMESIWVYGQVFAKKRWANWTLDEVLSAEDEQVKDLAGRRVVSRVLKQISPEQQAERDLAVRLMEPVFNAKAWSLNSFLWNQTDASGKPAYRDSYLRFLKTSLRVRQAVVANRGLQTVMLGAGDFRKAMGLDSEDRYRAFEKEWLTWEAAFLAKSQKPAWTATKDRVFGELGLK